MNDTTWADRLTLRQIAIFRTVAETGSIGAASDQIGLSQPAISHALNKMEATLGLALLRRGQFGCQTTGEGDILLRRARRFNDLLMDGLAAICPPETTQAALRFRVNALTGGQVAAHLAVAESGSFRAAAQRLGLSEPALQKTARALERLLEVQLYRRRHQWISVTEAGAYLAERMWLARAEIAQARDEVALSQGRSDARLSLGCLPLMPKMPLAKAFAALLARYPALRISLQEGSYEDLALALRQGRLDVLIGALRGPDRAPDLTETALCDDPYVVVCRQDHPLTRRGRALKPADLGAFSWVAATPGTPRRAALDALVSPGNMIALETNSVAMLTATLRESTCLSLSSLAQAQDDFGGTELAKLPLDVPPKDRQLGLSLRKDWLPTPVQARFLELMYKSWPEPADRTERLEADDTT